MGHKIKCIVLILQIIFNNHESQELQEILKDINLDNSKNTMKQNLIRLKKINSATNKNKHDY
jgi:hypothetical protein